MYDWTQQRMKLSLKNHTNWSHTASNILFCFLLLSCVFSSHAYCRICMCLNYFCSCNLVPLLWRSQTI
jgi:hypothetical protein